MDLDLEADVGELLGAFLGGSALVGALGTLALLLASGWRPGDDDAPLPRHALLIPVVIAAIGRSGRTELNPFDTGARLALLAVVVLVAMAAWRAPPLHAPTTTPLLLLTSLGLFAGLAETDGAIELASGVAVLLLLAPRRDVTAVSSGLIPVGVAVVVVAEGIRAGQVVGGIGSLGMIGVLALASLVPGVGAHLADRIRSPAGTAVVVVTQLLVVVSVARGPGLQPAIVWEGYAAPLALALLGLAILAHLPAVPADS